MFLANNYSSPLESTKKKVLIVDDDPGLHYLIERFLTFNNYLTQIASDCKTARQKFDTFNPDLVILDINLPDDTGFNLCAEMRKSNVAILMLSSMVDNNYIIEAFAKGADDYITKPFDLQILKARIDALLRRGNVATNIINDRKNIVLDNLEINFYRREVIINNRIVPLTALEFDLLHFLASNPNRVWDRAELISAIWNSDDYVGDDRKVDIHIGRIRKKIGDVDGEFIKTIWGRGYMFELSSSNAVN